MTEAGQGAPNSGRSSAPFDAFLDGMRKSFEAICDAVTPPEPAASHFREARIELWRGIRALVDHQIDRLSREPGQNA